MLIDVFVCRAFERVGFGLLTGLALMFPVDMGAFPFLSTVPRSSGSLALSCLPRFLFLLSFCSRYHSATHFVRWFDLRLILR